MHDDRGGLPGKYLRLVKDGQVSLYVPLEKHDEIEGLLDSGYEVAEEDRGTLKLVSMIRKAEQRRAWSEELRRRYISDSFGDFAEDAGSVQVVCPYCLARIGCDWPGGNGEVLCGWYDRVSKCDGTATYSVDRANLMLGDSEIEKYNCNVSETHLDLAMGAPGYLREEAERRSRAIRSGAAGRPVPECDVVMSKMFPLRVSVERTNVAFKEFILDLTEKDAIDWFNTLTLGELGSLLERAAS